MTETSSPVPRNADDVLRLLQSRGDVVAPHVAARLHAALNADARAIAQVAAALSPAQRAGISALPDPLPDVPAVAAALAPVLASLDESDRRLLLIAAISVDGRVDVALAAAGTTMTAALGSAVSPHLAFAAGRLAFTDPRVRVHVHASASLAERTRAHAALAAAYHDAGERALATWHRSLSTLEGDAALVDDLLVLAEGALDAGACEWAHAVAREAASHAPAATRLQAHSLAGRAALASGLVDDACTWLQGPVAASVEVAAPALAPYARAVALREGSVPDADIARHVAALFDEAAPSPATATGVLRAVTTAAQLHAEHGRADAARDMLDLAERIAQRHPQPRGEIDEAARWCALFGLEPRRGGPGIHPCAADPADVDRTGTATDAARIAAALELARSDRGDAALGLLQGGVGSALGASRPCGAGISPRRTSPLAEAHRRVTIALVLFWEGQLARARSELADAATVAPVALVFGGLAVALARRLDTVTDGAPLPTTDALDATNPVPQSRPLRSGLLVDRAIGAYLDGRMTEAGTLLSLAADDSVAPTDAGLPLPGLDEPSVWALAGRPDDARRAAERVALSYRGATASQRRSARARARLATEPPELAAAACRAAAEVCRTVASGYDRGRTEMLIGRRYAALGELDAARAHLLAAAGLFDAAGAEVWAGACRADLALLPSEPPVSVLTAPIAIPPARGAEPRPVNPRTPAPRADDETDVLADACRQAWGGVLTERELDVALLVTQGLSNREVAQRLFVSVRTVEVHLGRIFTKVGVASRVPLTVHAHRLAREFAPVAS